MEAFGAPSFNSTALPGQDNLTGSPWGNIAALDSNADLTDVLSTIRSDIGRGAFKVGLEQTSSLSTEAERSLNASDSSPLPSDTSGATPEVSSSFNQPYYHSHSTSKLSGKAQAVPLHHDGSTQDPVTGAPEGAPIVGAASQATNNSAVPRGKITDFNLNSQSDLVWRNAATGKNAVWLMQGTKLASSVSLAAVAGSSWRMSGTGDFNSDGQSDLVWRNAATGKNAVWLMQGTKLASSVSLAAVAGSSWELSYTNHIASPSSNFTEINWSSVKSSPIGSSETLGGFVDGKLYTFGGYVNSTFTPTRRSRVYDPASNTWTSIKDLPKGLTHAGTAVDEANNDIYLAGGYIEQADGSGQTFGTRNVWKYDVDTNTWTTLPSLPVARASGELSLLNGKLHFFGGTNIQRTQDVGNHWVLSLNGGTSWTSAAPLPNPRTHMGDAVINGKIYAVGGQHEHDQQLVTQNSVHEYNPATNKWRAVKSMPKALSHISSSTFVMDGRIIVAGGETDHTEEVADVTAYDPVSNSWTTLTSLPTPRRSGVAGRVGNQIFYTTGSPGFSKTTYKGVVAN